MTAVSFEDVSKSYGDVKVLEHFNLNLPEGSLTVLVGPSG